MKDHGFVCLSNNETVKEAILTERYIFISDFVDKMKLSLCSSHYEDDHQCPESCISFSPIKVNDLVTVMGKDETLIILVRDLASFCPVWNFHNHFIAVYY